MDVFLCACAGMIAILTFWAGVFYLLLSFTVGVFFSSFWFHNAMGFSDVAFAFTAIECKFREPNAIRQCVEIMDVTLFLCDSQFAERRHAKYVTHWIVDLESSLPSPLPDLRHSFTSRTFRFTIKNKILREENHVD